MTIFNRLPLVRGIPTVFDNCFTVEEQIYFIYNYIQNVLISGHNENAEAIEEIQNVLDTLQPYINNKLDEMLENGQFQEFIESEVFQDFNTRLETSEEKLDSIDEELEDITDDIVENTQNINANALEIQKLKDCFILKGEITLPANESHTYTQYFIPEEIENPNDYYLDFIGFEKTSIDEESRNYWNGAFGTGMQVGTVNYSHGNMTAKMYQLTRLLRIDLQRGETDSDNDINFTFVCIYRKYPDVDPIELEGVF